MELSVRDLLVPGDRQAGTSRGIPSSTSLAGLSSVSVAAFNDLLRQFSGASQTHHPAEARDTDRAPRSNTEKVAAARTSREAKPTDAPADDEADFLPADNAARDSSSDIDGDESASGFVSSPAPAMQEAIAPGELTLDSAVTEISSTAIGLQPTPTSGAAMATERGTAPSDAPLQAGPVVPVVPSNQNEDGISSVAGSATITSDKSTKPAAFNEFSTAFSSDVPIAVGPDGDSLDAAIADLVRTAQTRARPGATAVGADSVNNRGIIVAKEAGQASTPNLPEPVVMLSMENAGEEITAQRPMAGHGFLFAQELEADGIASDSKGSTALLTGNSSTGAITGANTLPSSQSPATSHAMNPAYPTAPNGTTLPQDSHPATPGPTNGATNQVIGAPGGVQLASGGTVGSTGHAQTASRPLSPQPVPVEEVAVRIAKAAAGGSDHISIKLKPAHLGQIDVKLELTHDGRVAAVITADRSDTLDMLARDAKSLERALADAGLKADSGSLQFGLRSGGDGHTGSHEGRPGQPSFDAESAPGSESSAALKAAVLASYANARTANGGVDIRV